MATTWKDITKRKLSQSDYVLIAANIVPVYGVWFLNWSAGEVFLVYCLETIIIGFFTLLKILITGLIIKTDNWQNGSSTTKMPFMFFMLFFFVHYGMFVSIQTALFFSDYPCFSGIVSERQLQTCRLSLLLLLLRPSHRPLCLFHGQVWCMNLT